MPFTFVLSGKPHDASYLSLIDAPELFMSNEKADDDVKRSTLNTLATHPIELTHNWFVNERGWLTTRKLLTSFQCALQYRQYVNKGVMRKRTLQIIKTCRKYKQERDNALEQLAMLREQNIEYDRKLQLAKHDQNRMRHRRSGLLSWHRHDRYSDNLHRCRLASHKNRKSALTCSQCGNTYPSVHSLQSHLIKRHKRTAALAANIANNIATVAADVGTVNGNDNSPLDGDFNDYVHYDTAVAAKSSDYCYNDPTDIFSLITYSGKRKAAAAHDELLELMENNLHKNNEVNYKYNQKNVGNHVESKEAMYTHKQQENLEEHYQNIISANDKRHSRQQTWTFGNQRNLAEHKAVVREEQVKQNNNIDDMLSLPGMTCKLDNECQEQEQYQELQEEGHQCREKVNTHANEQNKENEFLRELLQKTLTRLEKYELREAGSEQLAKVQTFPKHTMHSEQAQCSNSNVSTMVREQNTAEVNLDANKPLTISPSALTPPPLSPELLELPGVSKSNNMQQRKTTNKEIQVNTSHYEQHHTQPEYQVKQESHHHTHSLQDENSIGHDKISEKGSNEQMKMESTPPSVNMAISPLTISPLSVSNLPSPCSLTPESAHVLPFTANSLKINIASVNTGKNDINNNNTDNDKQHLTIAMTPSTQAFKESVRENISSLSDLTHTLTSDIIAKNDVLTTTFNTSMQSTRSRYNDTYNTDDVERTKNAELAVVPTSKNTDEIEHSGTATGTARTTTEAGENVNQVKDVSQVVNTSCDVPHKQENLARAQDSNKLELPVFSVSPKFVQPRKHTESERNVLTDECHVEAAITTSRAFASEPVVLKLHTPQEWNEEASKDQASNNAPSITLAARDANTKNVANSHTNEQHAKEEQQQQEQEEEQYVESKGKQRERNETVLQPSKESPPKKKITHRLREHEQEEHTESENEEEISEVKQTQHEENKKDKVATSKSNDDNNDNNNLQRKNAIQVAHFRSLPSVSTSPKASPESSEYLSKYEYDESSSYSFTSTTLSSKHNKSNNEKQVDSQENKSKVKNKDKLIDKSKEPLIVSDMEESISPEAKQERNTTYDDITAFTVSYDEDESGSNRGSDEDKEEEEGEEEEKQEEEEINNKESQNGDKEHYHNLSLETKYTNEQNDLAKERRDERQHQQQQVKQRRESDELEESYTTSKEEEHKQKEFEINEQHSVMHPETNDSYDYSSPLDTENELTANYKNNIILRKPSEERPPSSSSLEHYPQQQEQQQQHEHEELTLQNIKEQEQNINQVNSSELKHDQHSHHRHRRRHHHHNSTHHNDNAANNNFNTNHRQETKSENAIEMQNVQKEHHYIPHQSLPIRDTSQHKEQSMRFASTAPFLSSSNNDVNISNKNASSSTTFTNAGAFSTNSPSLLSSSNVVMTDKYVRQKTNSENISDNSTHKEELNTNKEKPQKEKKQKKTKTVATFFKNIFKSKNKDKDKKATVKKETKKAANKLERKVN